MNTVSSLRLEKFQQKSKFYRKPSNSVMRSKKQGTRVPPV